MRRQRSPRRAPALTGTISVPGDKSLSHRAVILGALGSGESRARGLNLGEDVARSIEAVRALGIEAALGPSSAERSELVVRGRGPGGPIEPSDVIDAGNSGTTLRTLLGICAAVDGTSVITGDETLRRRPMLRVVEPLRSMGARIDGRAGGDLPPLVVRGAPLQGINVKLKVASAQVKTALLLGGLRAAGETTVTEPGPSRDHTENLLASMGAPITRSGRTTSVRATESLDPLDLDVPGDFSSAMYLLAAALLVPGSDLTIEAVGLNPSRSAALEVLRRMGASVEAEPAATHSGEAVGSVRAGHSDLGATTIGGQEIPALIDELPILAVLASQAEGETVIRDAAELRVKESDRIAVMCAGLRALGADVEERPDGLVLRGPAALTGGEVEAHGDHRAALSFAVAGLVAADKVVVHGWSSIDTSFPEFLELLDQARGGRSARGAGNRR
ncbi:MAG: 3-phosphoshikimate 1-carboxyvinyltransferase [Actinomycetota bacterium]